MRMHAIIVFQLNVRLTTDIPKPSTEPLLQELSSESREKFCWEFAQVPMCAQTNTDTLTIEFSPKWEDFQFTLPAIM